MAHDHIAALVPAAGSGRRLGRGPKAFVPLGGRTLLERAVEALAPHVDEVVVAVPDGFVDRARALLPTATVLIGADSRQGTVALLLAVTDARWVLVHDAARPFLPGAIAREVVTAVHRHGAVTVALPVVDTLYHDAEGRTVDRSDLYAIQTPQAFERELLLSAHRLAAEAGLQATDDAELVRRAGHPVALMPGSAWLNKITTDGDLDLAEALATVWRRSP